MKNLTTTHYIYIDTATKMRAIESNSVALVVTSPPYPMIEMWDEIMANQNPDIQQAINNKDGHLAFELMHSFLDDVWAEVTRVLIPGGFACINIGDATRTLNGEFQLYSNHSRIIQAFSTHGLQNLPNIIWRKQTNAPNKFMGSGMLPSGAYVTLEHEWILIFRKGGKRKFLTEDEKYRRKASSFFWEERNVWFSDLWELKGIKQKIDKTDSRKRSAAYPFDIPYRLINMYSLQGETVLDPFMGTGTTMLAAIASGRNSIGYEIDDAFKDIIIDNINSTPVSFFNSIIESRINSHKQFLLERNSDLSKSEIKHFNENLNMPVMTKQETNIQFYYLKETFTDSHNIINARYSKSIPENNQISFENKVNRKNHATAQASLF
jgi:DNA modification methylase